MIFKKLLFTTLFPFLSLVCVLYLTPANAAVWEAAHPAGSFLQLIAFNYDYDPISNTVTMTYQYKNVSGSAITNPRLVNIFLWSNDICSTSWDAMTYSGSGGFSSAYQNSTVNDPDGLFNWNATISSPAPPLDSTGMFPALPTQSTQNGVSYPYFNICTQTDGTWANDEVATFSTSWDVTDPYWVQSESVVVSCEGGDCPAFPTFDPDNDSVTACYNDNCPATPNGPLLGTCVKKSGTVTYPVYVGVGVQCTSDVQCVGFGDKCELSQMDLYPSPNGCGDACECYADIVGTLRKVNIDDLKQMKKEYGRTDCATIECLADLNGDNKVNLTDLTIMKLQYNRTNCPC